MAGGPSTVWTLVEGAAAGRDRERALFAERYLPVVRAYLSARWRGTPRREDVEDATQEVFLDLFRPDGALHRLDASAPGGFRAFLYGVVRNVARHAETRRARRGEREAGAPVAGGARPGDGEGPDEAFDRAWAVAVVREALAHQRERALEAGDAPLRRLELLRLRFAQDLPVREVARRWHEDPARVHREYAKAREEFKAALLAVLESHGPAAPGGAVEEMRAVLARLR